MIATLGMYDMPSLAAHTDALWSTIRAEIGQGPDRLTRSLDGMDVWMRPDLLLSQTCGMPYRTKLHGKVQIVGTPDYDIEGCAPGYYHSVFIARAQDTRRTFEDFGGAVFAFNAADSQSGWAAPWQEMQRLSVSPGKLAESASHAQSAQAVLSGSADFAALDAVTWLLLQRTEPALASGLKDIGTTAPSPGLPYITSMSQNTKSLAAAVERAIKSLNPEHKSALHLKGFVSIAAASYVAVPTPPTPSDLGLPLSYL